jgi:hypothetical protein
MIPAEPMSNVLCEQLQSKSLLLTPLSLKSRRRDPEGAKAAPKFPDLTTFLIDGLFATP